MGGPRGEGVAGDSGSPVGLSRWRPTRWRKRQWQLLCLMKKLRLMMSWAELLSIDWAELVGQAGLVGLGTHTTLPQSPVTM